MPKKISVDVVQVVNGDKKVGWAFLDGDSHHILYQIAVPTAGEPRYSVISVLHEEPFEYVELGFNKTQKGAFSRVRQQLIYDTLTRLTKGML